MSSTSGGVARLHPSPGAEFTRHASGLTVREHRNAPCHVAAVQCSSPPVSSPANPSSEASGHPRDSDLVRVWGFL